MQVICFALPLRHQEVFEDDRESNDFIIRKKFTSELNLSKNRCADSYEQ